MTKQDVLNLVSTLADEQERTRALVKRILQGKKYQAPSADESYVSTLEEKYRTLKQKLILANLQIIKLQRHQHSQ